MIEVKYLCKAFEELSKSELYRILAARQDVFIVEQAICYIDCDFKDQDSLHCWAEDGEDALVAYLRIVKPGFKYREAAIGRVLTTKQARGRGIGKELMSFAINQSEQQFGSSAIRISAQCYLEKFYRDFGFTTVSEPYIEEGIQHIEMLR